MNPWVLVLPNPKIKILMFKSVGRLLFAGGFFIASVFSSVTLRAADYFVSPTGSDTAAGTATAPWKTITRALTGRVAGDVIRLQAGATFTESVTISVSGKLGAPITITSDPANRATIKQAVATKDGVLIYNSGYITLSNLKITGVGRSLTQKVGLNVYVDSGVYSGITLSNLEVSEFYRGVTYMGYSTLTTGFGYDGILMENCFVHHNLDQGLLTWSSTRGTLKNITIRASKFNDNYGDPLSAKNSGSGVTMGSVVGGLIERCIAANNGGAGNASEGPVGFMVYDSGNVTVQFCEAYGNKAKYQDGDGFDFDLGTYDSVMQYNYSHDNYGAGYLLSTDGVLNKWSGNIIRYNISQNDGYGGKMGGLHFYSPGTIAPLINSHVYNNTIYSNLSPAVWFYDFASMSGVKVRNNIFVTTNGQPIIKFQVQTTAPSTAQCQFQGNNYWSTGFALNIAGYTSLAAWRTGKGQEKNGTADVGFNVDPMLTLPGGGIAINDPSKFYTLDAYKLQGVSPMINAGLNLSTLFAINPGTQDFYGTALPQGGAYDVGAMEYYTVTSTPPGAPVAPSISSITTNSLVLSWIDGSTDESGFNIERSTDGVNYLPLVTVGANVTSYTNTGLTANTTYYYRVRAYNNVGTSAWVSVSGKTLNVTAPAAPTGLKATAGTKQVALTWVASTGATSYRIKRATTSSGIPTTIATVTGTSFTNTGLTSRTTYYYVVSAVNAGGESPNSVKVSATAK